MRDRLDLGVSTPRGFFAPSVPAVGAAGSFAPDRGSPHMLLVGDVRRRGAPVDTGFHVRGEPIVRTPEDTERCFRGTEPGALATQNGSLVKAA